MLLRKLWNLLNVMGAYLVIGALGHLVLYGVPDPYAAWTFVFLALWPLILFGKAVLEILLLGVLVVALIYLWD
ncbi:hypothetical protein [Parvibaculum sp.]|uniref:hypothetical protein n=1 Tax=Parvibaculum sp. TaxID=2024848 RepID=UPI002736A6BD|nr:hypothetical protein [Parvibaculum sp.]MDP3327167.1 hypothetical protein [Parvibaculum sp.]